MTSTPTLPTGSIFSFEGHVPDIHPDAYVAPGAVVIGRVAMAANTSLWFNAVLRGDLGPIEIGEGSNIQDLTTIHVEGSEERGDGREIGTFIGRDVLVGHNCVIHACTLEDQALIGMGAVVMSEAVIGRGAIVGAGSVVLTGTVVPPYALAVGNPAKVRKTYTPEEAGAITKRAVQVYRARVKRFKSGLRLV